MSRFEMDGPNVPFNPLKHVKKADHFEPHLCGHCPNLHVIMFDEHNVPFCDATFTAEQLVRLAQIALAGDLRVGNRDEPN